MCGLVLAGSLLPSAICLHIALHSPCLVWSLSALRTRSCVKVGNNCWVTSCSLSAASHIVTNRERAQQLGALCETCHPVHSSSVAVHNSRQRQLAHATGCRKLHHNRLADGSMACLQANPTGDPDHPGLSIAWGCCGHVFHLECVLLRFLSTCQVHCSALSSVPATVELV